MATAIMKRERICYSEKAFAYKMKNDAMKRTAGRPRSQIDHNLKGKRTVEIIAEETGESPKQVQRYIALTNLIPELLQQLDDEIISFNPAVELAALKENEQKQLIEAMDYAQSVPSLSQAQRIKKLELVDMATTYSQKKCEVNDHYFKVELIDVENSSYEILDEKLVKDYLRAVAPIPYDVGFMYTSKIHDFVRENGFRIDEYIVYVNGESLFKRYTTKLYEPHNNSRKAYDELIDVKFEIFYDDDGKPLAWMWYGVSKFEKQIPPINFMRGIRLRKANIQIGNESTFTSHDYYKEPRSGLYFVGEVFAVHPGLIPNARRDYFNLNNTCRKFEETLRPLFYDRFYRIYHYANDYKKALQKQNDAINAREEFKQKITSGSFINTDDKKEAEKKVLALEEAATKAAKTVETRDSKEGTDDVLSKVYGRLKKDYEVKKNGNTEKIKPSSDDSDEDSKKNGKDKFLPQKLSKYSKKEQKLIGRIYTILRSILPHDTASIVIQKIQEELNK